MWDVVFGRSYLGIRIMYGSREMVTYVAGLRFSKHLISIFSYRNFWLCLCSPCCDGLRTTSTCLCILRLIFD